MWLSSKTLRLGLSCTMFFSCWQATGQVAVRHTEGLVHGFLVLRNVEGEVLAHGDLIQLAHGNRVTAHLVFHFKDGSLYEETTIYSQLRNFRLLREHLVLKGPSFPHPEDVSIDAGSGQVTIHYTGDDGKEQVKTEHVDLPPDLANGLIFTLLKNIPPESGEVKASLLVVTPKPRLVKLAISAQGDDTFLTGGEKRKATHFVVKIEIGGITGLLAPIFGKQPPDINAWILRSEAPAFVRSKGPLYAGGPIWQIELESPVWPDQASEDH